MLLFIFINNIFKPYNNLGEIMKNTINYYYNITIENLIKTDHDYYFYSKNNEYHLIICNRPYEDMIAIYKLNVEMKNRGCIVHEIILNKDNQVVTIINDTMYVLLKACNYKNDRVFLNDINYIQNMTKKINFDKSLLRIDWVKMWSDKIDYYEYQISQLGKKYPILCDSLSYYIGLGENAISYIANVGVKDEIYPVVTHKRINVSGGSFEFYNPLNFVIDSRIRDISEYIKDCFFYDKIDYNEIRLFFEQFNLNYSEYRLLYARLLFPTYYFDVYDEIINNGLGEDKIIKIIEKASKFEDFLCMIYKYIVYTKKIDIEPVEWLIKRHSN